MSLMGALNTRASGAVDEAHSYVDHKTPLLTVVPAVSTLSDPVSAVSPHVSTAENVPAATAAETYVPDYDTEIVLTVGPLKKGATEYSDDLFVTQLKRVEKATAYMLAHMFDAEGAEQMPHFIDLMRDIENLATLRSVSHAG